MREVGSFSRRGLIQPHGAPELEYITAARPGGDGTTVFIFRKGQRPALSASAMKAIHGFTHREAEVASRVVWGVPAAQIARELGVGLPTVRTHIHQLLEKTGTTR